MESDREWLIGFGLRIRTEREKQNLTRHALAERVGTKQDYIAQIERGDKSPSLQIFRSIATALDVSADALIWGITAETLNNMEDTLKVFMDFLQRRSIKEIKAFYEIDKFLLEYIGVQ